MQSWTLGSLGCGIDCCGRIGVKKEVGRGSENCAYDTMDDGTSTMAAVHGRLADHTGRISSKDGFRLQVLLCYFHFLYPPPCMYYSPNLSLCSSPCFHFTSTYHQFLHDRIKEIRWEEQWYTIWALSASS